MKLQVAVQVQMEDEINFGLVPMLVLDPLSQMSPFVSVNSVRGEPVVRPT